MADGTMDHDGDEATQGGGFEWAAGADEFDFEEGSREATGRDSVLFVIDMSKTMYEVSEAAKKPKKRQDEDEQEADEPESALEKTLRVVRNVIRKRLVSNEQDLSGVVLYNTSKTLGTNFKNIYVFEELQRPGAEIIKRLDALRAMGPEELKTEFGSSEDCAIGDLLWACNSLFSNVNVRLAFKRIMVFTANDNPNAANARAISFAKQKAADVQDNGISIFVMGLSRAGSTHFKKSKFWSDIMRADEEDFDDRADEERAIATWEELEGQVTRKDHPKRAMARMQLKLAEGLELGVAVYNLVRTATKSAPTKLYSKTNEPGGVTRSLVKQPPNAAEEERKKSKEADEVNRRREKERRARTAMVERIAVESEGATVLMPSDYKKYMQFAGRNLYFTPEEIDSLKQFGPTGLYVIAFKPLSSFKPTYYIRPAQFLYPNEPDMKGSTKLFAALLTKCLEKKVMAICRYNPRSNMSPKLVALIPEEGQQNADHLQTVPEGFHIVFLPFADDFRRNLPKPRDPPTADDAAVQKARKLIEKLKFPFYVEGFQNPALAVHRANIEAMALNLDEVDIPDDLTQPAVEQQDRRAGKLMHDFMKAVYPPDYDPLGGAPKKRPAGDRARSPSEKKGPGRARKAAVGDGDGPETIEQAAEKGTLKKFTVAQLKEYCQKNKIKPDGSKKDDLIGAIETHLAGND